MLDSVQRYLGEALRTGRAATAGRVASALLRASGGWPWLAPGRDPGELLSLLARAAPLADGDPVATARSLSALAVGHCYHPEASAAAAMLERAEQLARRSGDPDVLAEVAIRDVELETKYLMGKKFHRGQDPDLGPSERSGI